MRMDSESLDSPDMGERITKFRREKTAHSGRGSSTGTNVLHYARRHGAPQVFEDDPPTFRSSTEADYPPARNIIVVSPTFLIWTSHLLYCIQYWPVTMSDVPSAPEISRTDFLVGTHQRIFICRLS